MEIILHTAWWFPNSPNPKRTGGGGGGGIRPPSMFRVIISRKFFPRCKLSWLFSLKSCATLGAIFGKIGRTVLKLRNIMYSNVGSKFDNFLDLCTKRMENGFLCQNSILSSKMQYLLSLQLKSPLCLVIFNTKQFHIKKTIKYIRNKLEVHRFFIQDYVNVSTTISKQFESSKMSHLISYNEK